MCIYVGQVAIDGVTGMLVGGYALPNFNDTLQKTDSQIFLLKIYGIHIPISLSAGWPRFWLHIFFCWNWFLEIIRITDQDTFYIAHPIYCYISYHITSDSSSHPSY